MRRKGMIHNRLMDVCMRNIWRKAERGKKPVLVLVTGFHTHLALRTRGMCAKNMGVHVQRSTLEYQRYENTGREIGFLPSQERREETSK